MRRTSAGRTHSAQRDRHTEDQSRLWLGYGGIGLLAAGIYFLLPSTSAQDLYYIAYDLVSVAMLLLGVRLHRPARRWPWYCFALGMLFTAGGDALWALHEIVLHDEVPFPSLADVLYLMTYPFFGAGLYLVIRSRMPARQWTQWLDATIIAVGFGLVSWVFLMAPYTNDPSLSLLQQGMSMAYPLMDVLLVAVAAQFVFLPGGRSAAFRFICVGLTGLVVADTLFSILTLQGTYQTGNPLDIGWLISHLGWSVAALHPSMAHLHEPEHEPTVALSWSQLALLTAAVLLAPGMLVLQFMYGEPIAVPTIAGASIVLFLCVLLRLHGVVRMLTLALRKVKHQAFHDALTGLPNRALFQDRLAHACARADRQGTQLAILFLDLDRFKVVNDSLGHAIGDELLVILARRLEQCLRRQDTLARMSGDEFTILLEDIGGLGDAVDVAERILAALEEPILIERHAINASVSIGIALHTPEVDQPADLLRYADVAMYQAKSTGKAHYEVFVRSMNAAALERLTLEQELRHGLERQEFEVLYQPIVNLTTQRLVGVEALVRWEHPTRGVLGPADFIPLAEDAGLIIPLGRWVLEEACRQIQSWRQAQGTEPALAVNVNLSAKQFQSPTLIAEVARVLELTGLPATCLTLEITETVVMDQATSTIATLSALRELGVKLAIDDFGTGYSSLSYLHRFAVDCLKIDRSFVRDMNTDRERAAIVRTIISLAHTLGLAVTAEGVETADEAALLEALGGEQAQGYFFCGPSPWPVIAALLAEHASSAQPILDA